ncbi:MAG: oxygen-independent coproporphyrinogen III oxidase [Hyphomicrobiaceae bacterium]|nr:oxygen-independent coproporphyrinogen III oxidase [Hyphomicrobiaceae bacterium]MCC0008588.1 oxygen-independent coproporphyrinogen III oxidase [Hyphomicrobiaceae bacterium]
MQSDLLRRYAAPVPRYTSYPTAPHFSPAVDAATYGRWLDEMENDLPLSLYVHIPFCNELCWYCGCSTKITRQREPIARYLSALSREIDTVADRIKIRHAVTHIHWGGGSPSILEPNEIRALAAQLKTRFKLSPSAEFAVEIDPRGLDEARIAAFADSGVNRVSIGVQDFDLAVQKAINRMQSVEQTAWVVDTFRKHGIEAINIDLVYGLPKQTLETLDQTMDHVLALAPDRIALFGYAHLPARIKHQRLIPDDTLPDTAARFAQANRAAERLTEGGFVTIGLDHYARPHDPLASGTVRRNFQGYTTDTAAALIGLGASSIGRLPQGYVQNTPAIGEYERRVLDGGLATVRGHAMSTEDAARGLVIERLMCDFAFPADELRARFGEVAEPIIAEAEALCAADRDEMVAARTRGEGFEVTDKGRIFVRSICAKFDAYLGKSSAQHSAGI